MITIQRVVYKEKSILRNLLQFYHYDFSEFEPELDINAAGLYEYKYLDHYWTEDSRHPFFIKVGEQLAGFALIREIGRLDNDNPIYSMAEFFVMRKYRKTKVGQGAAHQLFQHFPGIWKVGQIETNIPAQTFWRKTISRYTNGHYDEIREEDWDGPIQKFSSIELFD
ncbi:GNAT family N-acetyltransferase [Paenibacillus sp. 1001270B_150601_E10]|uniref:GNAT family N-acetyltransferase n=1 Tax=Paenibacillus sp. 1001270B_150601_E10 TaxID=2787079 RepID=UPI00189EA17A|nr:GNAT family N-acetyltransferase [Paenibacillus sp. 1001270B_150601_E10]